jgi:hypothetical protein
MAREIMTKNRAGNPWRLGQMMMQLELMMLVGLLTADGITTCTGTSRSHSHCWCC